MATRTYDETRRQIFTMVETLNSIHAYPRSCVDRDRAVVVLRRYLNLLYAKARAQWSS